MHEQEPNPLALATDPEGILADELIQGYDIRSSAEGWLYGQNADGAQILKDLEQAYKTKKLRPASPEVLARRAFLSGLRRNNKAGIKALRTLRDLQSTLADIGYDDPHLDRAVNVSGYRIAVRWWNLERAEQFKRQELGNKKLRDDKTLEKIRLGLYVAHMAQGHYIGDAVREHTLCTPSEDRWGFDYGEDM
jgi:hypothetical protein